MLVMALMSTLHKIGTVKGCPDHSIGAFLLSPDEFILAERWAPAYPIRSTWSISFLLGSCSRGGVIGSFGKKKKKTSQS